MGPNLKFVTTYDLAIDTHMCMIKINELQIPWLQTAIYYTIPGVISCAGVTGSGHITCHAHATLMSGHYISQHIILFSTCKICSQALKCSRVRWVPLNIIPYKIEYTVYYNSGLKSKTIHTGCTHFCSTYCDTP